VIGEAGRQQFADHAFGAAIGLRHRGGIGFAIDRQARAEEGQDEAAGGVGGILGAILTGVLNAPGLGGQGGDDYSVAAQVTIQVTSVVITIVWSGVVSIIGYKVADAVVGLRVVEDAEREGLDTSEHGERAYVT
jgi:Amt family ammonium transporter